MTSSLFINVAGVYCDFATHRPVGMLQASATLTEANITGQSRAPPDAEVKSAVSQQMEHLGALKIAECSGQLSSSFLHVSQPGVRQLVPTIKVSLFAKAISLPASIAAMVGSKPAQPTIPVTTVSASP